MMQYDGIDFEKHFNLEELDELRKKVVVDVDVSDAQKKFTSVEERIQSLKKSLYDLKTTAQEKIEISDSIVNTFDNMSTVVGEKLRQVEENIKQASDKIQSNLQLLGKARPGSGMQISLRKENEELRKVISERKSLIAEYTKEMSHLHGTYSGLAASNANGESADALTNRERSLKGTLSSMSDSDLDKTIGEQTSNIEKLSEELLNAQDALTKLFESGNADDSSIAEAENLIKSLAQARQDAINVLSTYQNEMKARTAKKNAPHVEEPPVEDNKKSKGYPLEVKRKGGDDKETILSNELPEPKDTEEAENQIYAIGNAIEELQKKKHMLQYKVHTNPGNNKEFAEQLKETEGFIEELTQKRKELKDAYFPKEDAGETENPKQDSVESFKSRLQDVINEIKEVDDEIDKLKSDIENVGGSDKSLTALLERKKALEEEKRTLEEVTESYQDSGSNATTALEALDAKIAKTQKDLAWIRGEAQNGGDIGLDDAISEANRLQKELKQLESARKALIGEQPKEPKQTGGKKKPEYADPQSYQQLEKWISTLQNSIAVRSKRLEKGNNDDSFSQEKQRIEELQAELKHYQALKAKIDSGERQPSRGNAKNLRYEISRRYDKISAIRGGLGRSANVEQDVAQIKALEREIKELERIYSEVQSADRSKGLFPGLVDGAQAVIGALSSVGGAIAKIGQVAVNAGAKFAKFGWEKLKQGASASVAVLGNLARSGFNLAVSGAKGLVSGLGTLARSGFNLAVSGAKKFMAVLGKIGSVLGAIKGGINTFLGGLKSLAHRMTHVGGRASKGLLRGLMSIKSMLMRRVKRTFISAIFNQAKEGLQAFAQYSDSFNTAMSNIKNSASEASGNLSATLGNLVDYISPALESILGVIVKVTQALNSMMAMLNGKSTVTVAKKSTDDYAKSLGKASGAAKDLNHQLYGFDEITRQESDNGGGSSGGVQYEEKAIDSVVGTGLADKFKEIVDAIKNKEFQKAGDLIGKVFTDIINKINEKIVEFRSKATGWAKDIGEGINGLFEGIDFNALGDTLAQGFNLLFDTVGTLIDTIDFGLVGQSLGEALNGLVSGLEWDTVGSTIVGALNGIFDAAYGLFTTVDFGKLAEGLVTGIDTIIASLDTNKLSSALQAGVNGIIEGLSILIEKINWDNLSSKLFVGLTKLIDGINWEGLGETVGNALNKVVLIVQNLINSGALPALAESLGTGLSAAFANINFADLGATLGDAVSTVVNTIGTLATSIDFPSIGSKLAEGINALFDPNKGGMNWSNAVESVKNGVNNIIAGIGRLLAPASEGGVDFSKIASFLTTTLNGLLTGVNWNGLASAVGTGVNGIISALGSILTSDVLKNLATKLGGIVNTLLDKIDWGNLGTIITNGVASILEAFGTLATTIDFPKLAQSLAEGINSLFDPEKGGVKWDGAIKAVSEGVNNIIAGIGKLLAPADEGGINFTAIAEFLMKAINGLLDNVNWEGLATAVSTGVNGILDALGAILTSDTLVNLATNLGDTVNTLLTNINWTQLGTDIGTGIGTLATAFGKLIETIDLPTIATNLASGVNALFDPEQGGANLDALGELVSTALNNIVAAFGNLIAPAEDGGINFENISTFLSDNINTLIAEGDFDGLLTTAGNIILSIGTKLLETIADIDWATLGTKLADGLSGIFNDAEGNFDQTKFERLGQALSEGLKSLLEGISNLLTGIDLEAVVSGIVEFVKQLDLTSVIKTILDTLFTLIPNIVDAIPTLLQGIVDLITQLDFADILTAFVTGMGAVMKKGPELLSSILETLVDGLVALLADTDWGQIITAMITNIVNEITTKIELVTKLIPTVVEGITKIITEVPWLDILKSIGDGLLKGLTEAGDSLMKVGKELLGTIFGDSVLGDVGKALGGFFGDIGNWFGGAKEAVEGAFNEAGEWIGNAAKGVADTVSGWWRSIFGGGDNGNQGAEEVKKGFNEIINTTRDSTEELSRTVVDSTHSNLLASAALLSNGLTDVFDKMCADAKIPDRAKEQLREQAGQLVSFLQAPDKSVQDIKTKFARLGIEITDELAGAIKGQGADDISYALQLLALGVDQETVAMLMDTNLSENIDQYMNDTGASIVDIANQLGADVGAGIGGTIPEAIAKALELGTKDIVKTKGEMVKEASITTEEVQSGSDSGSSMGSGVTGGVEAGMNEGKEGIETATSTVVQTIDDKLKELPEGEQENAKKMMDMLLAGILEGDPLVQTAIQESAQAVVNNVKEILSGDTGKEIALNFLNSMSGVFDSYQGIYVYANNLAVQCLKAVEAYVNYSNGAVIGSNMVVGMINGINAYGQTLVNAMAYICQCTAETARNILGIASPSKVFTEIGGFVMEGMENGINDTGRDAISAVGDVANSIIDEAKSADSVSVKVNAMTNGLDTVESKMSRIAKIFSDIADTITEMGGFEIPTVASGKVLPYRARVNTEPTGTESNALSNRNNLEDALYSAIMRAMGDNVEREQNVNVYLDGKDITDAVNKYQRQQSRAWGV